MTHRARQLAPFLIVSVAVLAGVAVAGSRIGQTRSGGGANPVGAGAPAAETAGQRVEAPERAPEPSAQADPTVPATWPAGAGAAYGEEVLWTRLGGGLGELRLPLVDVECSAFPCIAVFDVTGHEGADRPALDAMPEYAGRLPYAHAVVRHGGTAWSLVPLGDVELTPDQRARLSARMASTSGVLTRGSAEAAPRR